MKRRNLSFLLSICAAFAFFAFCPVESKAQTQTFVPPVQLYKFRVHGNDLGYFLTATYSEGVSRGFTYESVVGYIHVPCPGSFPCIPGSVPTNPNLRPVYRYRVVQGNRTYFYHGMYTVAYGSPGYYYEGIIGYMYDQALNQATVQTIFGGTQTYTLHKIKGCYSQSKGYYYGKLTPYGTTLGVYLFDAPPGGVGFDCSAYHGTVGGGIFSGIGTAPFATQQVSESYNWAEFNSTGGGSSGGAMDEYTDYPVEVFEEPPPPPACNPTNSQLYYCARNDGWWDYESCSCQYF